MSDYEKIHIRGGRLIDPANGIDAHQDLFIADGKVCGVDSPPDGFSADRTLDAKGMVVCPGLVDLSAHVREPGQEHKATIASETAAAAQSGVTTLCCPPDTDPVIDTPAVATLIYRRALRTGHAQVLPIGALTHGLQGTQLSEMAALKQAHCAMLGNAGVPITNILVQRRAMEYAATFGITVVLRPEDHHLRGNGCVHEGAVATRLGLPSIPEAAETIAVSRDVALAAQTGCTIHFRGLSSGAAVHLVARAQQEGLPVSADVSAHQLHLTDENLDGFNSHCHTSPPLRSLADQDALRKGVKEGVIGAICSDHQPHEPDAKEAPFPSTLPGISALETLLPLTLDLVQQGVVDLPDAIARLTLGPADILHLPLGRLSRESRADVCIFDPQATWTLTPESMISAGTNTPFLDRVLTGRVAHTLFQGRLVFSR